MEQETLKLKDRTPDYDAELEVKMLDGKLLLFIQGWFESTIDIGLKGVMDYECAGYSLTKEDAVKLRYRLSVYIDEVKNVQPPNDMQCGVGKNNI
mgnify:CR=1 FL=1